MLSLKDGIKKDFDFLFENNNFVLLDDSLEEKMLPGYGSAIIQKGNVRLRFIKDRADFFLDVGTAEKPQEWCDIYEIIDQLKRKGLISEYVKPLHKPNAIKRVLKKYISLIIENAGSL